MAKKGIAASFITANVYFAHIAARWIAANCIELSQGSVAAPETPASI